MEFESQLGVFSPDGRLIQVEYAQNASAQGSSMALQNTGDSVKIFYEDRQVNSLVISTDKIHKVDAERQIYMAFSGLKPDSLKVLNEAINICCNYKYSTSEDISMWQLAKKIGEFKQQFTVSKSMRPLGLRSVLFGFEKNIPRIFIIETDGIFSEYKKCAVGYKNDISTKYLEEHDEDDCALQALLSIVQKDTNKIKGFELKAEGLNPIDPELIKPIVEQ